MTDNRVEITESQYQRMCDLIGTCGPESARAVIYIQDYLGGSYVKGIKMNGMDFRVTYG